MLLKMSIECLLLCWMLCNTYYLLLLALLLTPVVVIFMDYSWQMWRRVWRRLLDDCVEDDVVIKESHIADMTWQQFNLATLTLLSS